MVLLVAFEEVMPEACLNHILIEHLLMLTCCGFVLCITEYNAFLSDLFSQFSNNHGFLDSKRLKLFLQEMLQVIIYIFCLENFIPDFTFKPSQ